MKTPVLIPAYNEAGRIRQTLETLPRAITQPIVIANAAKDETVAVAEQAGAETISIGQQGKMLAIQAGIRWLGEKATEPFVVLDADTRPCFPARWLSVMTAGLRPDEGRPAALASAILFTDTDPLNSLVWSLNRRARHVPRTNHANAELSPGGKLMAAQCGPSMSFYSHNQELVDAILQMPNYWPGEDLAMAQQVFDHGGTFRQTLHPGALVRTPLSESYPHVLSRFGVGGAQEHMVASYTERAPKDAVPFSLR